jgi:hypothetical protein
LINSNLVDRSQAGVSRKSKITNIKSQIISNDLISKSQMHGCGGAEQLASVIVILNLEFI